MSIVPSHFNSRRLAMRPFSEADAEEVFAYASDSSVTRLMDWATHTDISMSKAFIKETQVDWLSGEQFSWAITLQDSDELIGSVACGAISHKVSFGYVLLKSAWHQGYATEASTALVQLLEAIPQVARVWATCDTDNDASARVLEKCGLAKEGILRNWAFRPNLDNHVRDSYVFGKVVGNQHDR